MPPARDGERRRRRAAGPVTGPRRRRVLVVAWWYPSAGRPVAGTFVAEHARAAARRHDVVVLALEPAVGLGAVPFRLTEGDEHGIRTLRVRYPARPGAGPAAYVAGALVAARRLARSGFRPDVVHAHVYMGGLIGAPLARAWHAPLILSEHYSGFQLGTLHAAERLLARLALRAATIVCPPSASLRRALEPLAPRARFRVVPNPVDTAQFHPGDTPRGGDRLLFVGNLEPVKGLPDLLAAVAILRRARTDVCLDVVGGGAHRAEYEALARRLGLTGVVAFRGPLPKPAVAEAMRAADLLAVPSLTETFGTVVVEALASGLPVVATRVGALPELLDAPAGRLVAPGDPEELAAALERALDGGGGDDPVAVARAARERYGLDAIADAWSAVYADATACCRRGT